MALDYINEKQPLIKDFNRSGLYRTKQFYTVYSNKEIVSALLTQFKDKEKQNVSPAVPRIKAEIFYRNEH